MLHTYSVIDKYIILVQMRTKKKKPILFNMMYALIAMQQFESIICLTRVIIKV